MKCVACQRPLVRFTVQIDTPDGPVGWGPKCAERVVVKPGRVPTFTVLPRSAQPRRRYSSPAQLSLDLQ